MSDDFTVMTSDDFAATREPLRAIRDLISACEGVFGADVGEDALLRRAQDGFTSLRKLFGDNRPGEEIAFAAMLEPSEAPIVPTPELLATLQLVAGALQCVAKVLPERECHVVKFTGDFQSFGCWSIDDILDRANAALGEPVALGEINHA